MSDNEDLHKNASVLTPTQKYGVKNPMLSKEASAIIFVELYKIFLNKLKECEQIE